MLVSFILNRMDNFMKNFTAGALALVLAFPAVAIAQERTDRNKQSEQAEQSERTSRDNQPSNSRQQSAKAHKFAKGERFDRSRAQNYRRIDHRSNSHLSAAPRGYIWVRAGNDALLVRLSNNVVMRVVGNAF